MELRQLEYFLAIADEGSFTRAALRARVAQPAISQQIRRLERELGQELIRRDRPVRLTPAGFAFLPHARAVLDAAESGRRVVAAPAGELAGRFTFGTVQAPPRSVTELLGRFHRDHPGVEVSVRVGHSGELAAQVASGALDAALVGLGGQAVPVGVRTREINAEPLVVAVAADHPWVARTKIGVRALRDQPLVTMPQGTGMRTLIETACVKSGFAPMIRTETNDVFLLAELARHGLGVAVLPRSTLPRDARGLHLLLIERPTLRRVLALAWLRSRSSAVGLAFTDFAGSLPELREA